MTTQKLPKVFIVGESGTTGLRLHDRLISRSDIELLSLPDEKEKISPPSWNTPRMQISCSFVSPMMPPARS